MKIKLINNSFFEITTNKNYKLVCDPWIGNMDDTGTWSYPNMSSNKKILNKIKPDLVYISHLHTDHYDEKIIKNLKNKNVKFLVKKFKDQRLKKKLLKLKVKNVLELEAWKTYNFKSFEITIIPCDQSNNLSIDTFINYDLDTSILIYEKNSKTCFYNNVDNPCGMKILKKVLSIAKNKYGKIDIASFAPRPASEYPQNFINLNNKEKLKFKENIISRTIKSAYSKCKNLSIKNYIPAGGSFIIYGKYHKLQKFVAHPSVKQMDNYFIKKKIKYYNIDNCGYVLMNNGNVINYKKTKNKEEKFIFPKKLKKKKYLYQTKKVPVNFNINFYKARENYYRLCKKLNIKKRWKINFFLYKNLRINNKYKIINKDLYTKKYQIYWNGKKNRNYKLNLYLDSKLFYQLINNLYNWNMAIGGGLILFERTPNKFIPDIPFSLNFLKV